MSKTEGLLKYFLERYNYIDEGKGDKEYEKSFSSIPRDVFDIIVSMDPKTQKIGDEIQNIGFGSKQLLLPKYMSGEVDFLDNADEIYAALEAYYPNIAKYPKFNQFKSVSEFLTFMKNPDSVTIQDAPVESALDKLYNKFYSSIPRDVFNRIIALDPNTREDRIGEVAKNLLLASYIKGEVDFLELDSDTITKAIEAFYEKGKNYPDGKNNINNYDSVKEFVNYTPVSPTLASVSHLQAGVDYELVASSANNDLIKLLTWEGSRALSHNRGADNVWCTGGGSTGDRYLGSDGISTYWKDYQPDGPRHTQLYQILNRHEPQNRMLNYNIAINVQSGRAQECRNGHNNCPGEDHPAFLTNILVQDPELAANAAQSSDPLIRSCPSVINAYEIIRYASEPLIIENSSDFKTVVKNYDALKNCAKEIEIRNVQEIPFGMFSDFIVLQKLTLGEGIIKIGGQAFKGCTALPTVIFPETLEVIDKDAFSGCIKLKGAIKLPDSVKRIGRGAFTGTHCKLKINRDRTTKLKMDKADMDWIKSHVQSIQVN